MILVPWGSPFEMLCGLCNGAPCGRSIPSLLWEHLAVSLQTKGKALQAVTLTKPKVQHLTVIWQQQWFCRH